MRMSFWWMRLKLLGPIRDLLSFKTIQVDIENQEIRVAMESYLSGTNFILIVNNDLSISNYMVIDRIRYNNWLLCQDDDTSPVELKRIANVYDSSKYKSYKEFVDYISEFPFDTSRLVLELDVTLGLDASIGDLGQIQSENDDIVYFSPDGEIDVGKIYKAENRSECRVISVPHLKLKWDEYRPDIQKYTEYYYVIINDFMRKYPDLDFTDQDEVDAIKEQYKVAKTQELINDFVDLDWLDFPRSLEDKFPSNLAFAFVCCRNHMGLSIDMDPRAASSFSWDFLITDFERMRLPQDDITLYSRQFARSQIASIVNIVVEYMIKILYGSNRTQRGIILAFSCRAPRWIKSDLRVGMNIPQIQDEGSHRVLFRGASGIGSGYFDNIGLETPNWVKERRIKDDGEYHDSALFSTSVKLRISVNFQSKYKHQFGHLYVIYVDNGTPYMDLTNVSNEGEVLFLKPILSRLAQFRLKDFRNRKWDGGVRLDDQDWYSPDGNGLYAWEGPAGSPPTQSQISILNAIRETCKQDGGRDWKGRIKHYLLPNTICFVNLSYDHELLTKLQNAKCHCLTRTRYDLQML